MTQSKKLKAFSFIELGIVLLVVGVLATAVFKGKDLIDSAKSYGVVQEVHALQQAVHQYVDMYQFLPGDDPKASRFGAANGNGNKKIDADEESLFWNHLYKAGLIKQETALPCKLGGSYSIVIDNNQEHWIQISNNGEGALTPKQAKNLSTRFDGSVVEDGKSSQGLCLSNGNINLTNDKPVCIVKIKLH